MPRNTLGLSAQSSVWRKMYFLKGEMVYKFRVLLVSVLNRKKKKKKQLILPQGTLKTFILL